MALGEAKDELSCTKKKKMETYSRNVHNQFPAASQIHICMCSTPLCSIWIMKQSFAFLWKQQVVSFLLDAFGVTSGLVAKVSGIDTMKPCTCHRQAIIASTVLVGVVIVGRRGNHFTHESSVYKIHVQLQLHHWKDRGRTHWILPHLLTYNGRIRPPAAIAVDPNLE
jgi:hypothetical protein